jgi:hypothetical protein
MMKKDDFYESISTMAPVIQVDIKCLGEKERAGFKPSKRLLKRKQSGAGELSEVKTIKMKQASTEK